MPESAARLQDYLRQRIALVEAALDTFLPQATTLPRKLHDAMRYSVFAGGKRIRPVLMAAACEAVGGKTQEVMPAAAALEMIHGYSLIHDDLPAMDDDDLRRGRPTNHKVYGEALAILAGDGLLTEAFILLSSPLVFIDLPVAARLEVIHLLARAAGSLGMVGGQVVDMESEGQVVDLPTLEYIHTHKPKLLHSTRNDQYGRESFQKPELPPPPLQFVGHFSASESIDYSSFLFASSPI